MEAKELRIGNYVSNINGEIIMVSAKNIIEQRQSELANVPCLWKISLTERWLRDFGFKRKDKGSVSAQFHIGTNPINKDWLLSLIWLKKMDYSLEDCPFYLNGHFKIKYVHQLQNLFFSITGSELKLKS